jgi:hypothetical protein
VKDIDLHPSSFGFGRCHHLGAKLAGRLTRHPEYGVYTGCGLTVTKGTARPPKPSKTSSCRDIRPPST